jgi:PTS system nitrogen regulatory IIA component
MTDSSTTDEMRIFRWVGISNKKKLFERLAEVLSTVSEDLSFEDILDSLTNRERMGSTCIGDEVAIPHCKLAIDEPCGAIVLLDEPVMCSTKEQPISVVFAFIIPEQECQTHLPLLSEIAAFCREGNWLQRIKSATSDSDLCDILQSSEFNLAPYVKEISHT